MLGRGRCRNPRCSLEARAAWAWKSSLLLSLHLQRPPSGVRMYAGTLVGPPADHAGVLARRKAFREGIAKLGKGAQFLAVAEVGPVSGRLHDHYAMTAEGEVSGAEVATAWRKACGDPAAKVDHAPVREVGDWSRYMFKAGAEHHDPGNPACVRLFAKGSPRITWGTRAFLPEMVKAALWARWKAATYPAPELAEVRAPAIAPPRSSTRVLTAARRWTARRRSEVVRRRPGRPAARPAWGAARPGRRQRGEARPGPRCLTTRGPPSSRMVAGRVHLPPRGSPRQLQYDTCSGPSILVPRMD